MMPEILFLDHAGVLGGAELYLLDVARDVHPAGRVLLFEDGPFLTALREEGIAADVVEAPAAFHDVTKQSGVLSALQALPAVTALVREVAERARSADLLYANSQKALIVGALAGRLARRPVIWNLHDMLTADHFSTVTRRLAVSVANRWTDRIIVNSKATQSAFAACGGDAAKTAVVYNGIDPAPFEAVDPGEVAALRGQHALDGAPVVGVFGRLAPWKGQHVLLEALPDLPDVHALLVGEALFRGDAAYARRLHALADALGVTDRVHFLGFREDVPRLMKLVDVVVHTSVAPEPFGRVLVEGMLARRPVVATDAGGAREVVDHETTGLLVPPDDPRALAAALQPLLDRPDRRERLGTAGYRYAQQHFSREQMLRGVRRHLHAVLERTLQPTP